MSELVYPQKISGLSYADYCSRPGLRASYLAAIDRGTPGTAEYERTHQADKTFLRWGTALHAMILEPARFADEYTIGGPTNPKTGNPYGSDTKAFLEWAAEQRNPILTREEHRLIVGMADSIAAHPLARTIRDGPRETELSVFWKRDGQPCKARLDCVQENTIWDIKTCRDAGYRGFERAIADYRYHMAASWYMQGWDALNPGKTMRYLWLAVENAPPYALAVYEASLDLLQVGFERINAAVETVRTCTQKNHWPVSYCDEEILMQAPRWMLPDENSLEG